MESLARNKILVTIKSHGAQTAAALARTHRITPVAVRQHLDQLHGEQLVVFEDIAAGRGRPKRTWSLTDKGHARFPDSHSELLLGMIGSVRELFGEDGLSQLIDARRTASIENYTEQLKAAGPDDLSKLQALARARDAEGYMAHIEQESPTEFLLVENHCSICAAAQACQGFCRAEQQAFEAVVGPEFTVVRIEHRLSGARRCVYKFEKSVQ